MAAHHAIYYAAQGYSTTGIDGLPTAIERAKRNAERAEVRVDFPVADATQLDAFKGRFDTMSGMEKMRPLRQQMAVLRPLLHDGLVHVLVWSVAAARLD